VNEIFEVEYTGSDREGRAIKGTVRYPAYACGHCTQTVILNPKRVRPRVMCKKCGRWLCEKNELCMTDCTPIYEMANDRSWTEESRWTRLLPGIMKGAVTLDDAQGKGLIKE
jgi:hypothetical protein